MQGLLGVQTVPVPRQLVLPQMVWEAMVQAPLVAQQAPSQRLGVQVVRAPRQVYEQADWTRRMQPNGSQQAPVGWGQGLGVQVVPAPSQVCPAVQAAWVRKAQPPVEVVQQAPPGGQGLEVQTAPG
jgi:hypothetical protein